MRVGEGEDEDEISGDKLVCVGSTVAEYPMAPIGQRAQGIVQHPNEVRSGRTTLKEVWGSVVRC